MVSFQWYLTDKRIKLLEEIEKVPDAKAGISQIIETALEEWFKKHGSGNPTYPMDNYINNPEFIAIPALLASKDQRNGWLKIQAGRGNWSDLKDIKFTCQEWLGELKKYGI